MTRTDNRAPDQPRPFSITRQYTKYAAGSVLVEAGDTKVICTASVENKVPIFLKDSGQGWITAEYAMLPGATHTRGRREVSKGRPTGRTSEIQRLIGRSLRAALDLEALADWTVQVDADVIQADGGTRTAAISGSMVALWDAMQHLLDQGEIKKNPIKSWIGAISVGVLHNQPIVDLCYEEDSIAEVDMNVVMTEQGDFIEVQGTAENRPFSQDQLNTMLDIAGQAITTNLEIAKASIT